MKGKWIIRMMHIGANVYEAMFINKDTRERAWQPLDKRFRFYDSALKHAKSVAKENGMTVVGVERRDD